MVERHPGAQAARPAAGRPHRPNATAGTSRSCAIRKISKPARSARSPPAEYGRCVCSLRPALRWSRASARSATAATSARRPAASAGTKSSPCVPQGWQRRMRASAIQPPAHSPKRRNRLVGIVRTARQMPAARADQRRQRIAIDRTRARPNRRGSAARTKSNRAGLSMAMTDNARRRAAQTTPPPAAALAWPRSGRAPTPPRRR